MLSFPAMKHLRLTILTVAMLAAMSLSAAAQTKLASVNLNKLLHDYWKTKQAKAALDKQGADQERDLKTRADDIDKQKGDYKQLLDQSNDPAISADERDKRKQSAQAKAKDIYAAQAKLEQDQRLEKSQLDEENQRMLKLLLTDIQKAVADRAKVDGYTMVLNGGLSEAFVYVSPQTDITDDVLKQLNAGAPIDLTRPASAAASGVSTNLPQ
jgi:outer membrane protein